jgi:hypothetical protein
MLLALWAIPAKATISIVQSAHTTDGAGISTGGTLTVPSTTTGNMIGLQCIMFNGQGAITSITDGGDTFLKADNINVGGSRAIEIWYALNIASGHTTLTFNFTAGGTLDCYYNEFHTTLSGFALDVHGNSTTSTGTTVTGTSLTTTGSNDVILAAVDSGNQNYTGTAANGGDTFTMPFVWATDGPGTVYLLNSAAGTHQVAYTATPSASGFDVSASFKETSAASPLGTKIAGPSKIAGPTRTN